MAVSIKFNLGPDYPPEFPQSLSLSETDPLSHVSYQDAFQAAQNARLPHYNVTVVESGNPGEKFYHTYDSIYFHVHTRTSSALIDPFNRRPVQRVHTFAIRCFQLDKDLIFRPVDLVKDKISAIRLKIEDLDLQLITFILESMNANIFVPGKKTQQRQMREMQYHMACFIQKGNIFPELTATERKREAMQWLWCSQDNYQSLTQLVKNCLTSHDFNLKAQQAAIKLLSKKLTPPPSKDTLSSSESLAVIEGLHLLEKYRKIKAKKQKKVKKEETKDPIVDTPSEKKKR